MLTIAASAPAKSAPKPPYPCLLKRVRGGCTDYALATSASAGVSLSGDGRFAGEHGMASPVTWASVGFVPADDVITISNA